MYAFDTAPQFRAAGPAAVALIDYLDDHAELKASPWDFERGTVSSNGRSRAWAEFSQEAAVNRFMRDRVSIIAMETTGGWKLSHSVTRAER
ncbi:MAG: hypothetical protein JWQ73_4375 [Variovorax sp.]|nr:hypothetical protein [Variovorax sp.]